MISVQSNFLLLACCVQKKRGLTQTPKITLTGLGILSPHFRLSGHLAFCVASWSVVGAFQLHGARRRRQHDVLPRQKESTSWFISSIQT